MMGFPHRTLNLQEGKSNLNAILNLERNYLGPGVLWGFRSDIGPDPIDLGEPSV